MYHGEREYIWSRKTSEPFTDATASHNFVYIKGVDKGHTARAAHEWEGDGEGFGPSAIISPGSSDEN